MYRIFFSVMLVFSLFTVDAQQHYLFNRYTTNDGLASNRIFCATQDKMGYLWVGTANGLQRFDGKRFLNIPLTGNNPLSFAIHGLVADSKGNIVVLAGFTLVSGAEAGIIDPSTLRYEKIPFLVDIQNLPKGICRIFNDSQGHIFITSSLSGLYEFDASRKAMVQSPISASLPKNWGINYIYEDKSINSYYLSSDSGLAIYDRKRKELYTHDHNPKELGILKEKIKEPQDIKIDSEGRIWIVDFNGKDLVNILCYDKKSEAFLPRMTITNDRQPVKMDVRELYLTWDKKLWAAGFHAFLNFDNASQQFYQYKDPDVGNYGIKYEQTFSIFEDREKLLWVCTSDGLYYFDPKRQGASYFLLPTGKETYFNKLILPKENEIWAGTLGNGVYILDTSLKNSGHPDPQTIHLGNRWITTMFKSSHVPFVFISTTEEILSVDLDTKKIVKRINTKSINGDIITSITEDRRGNLWFADRNRNLYQLPSGKTFESKNILLAQRLPDFPTSMIAGRNSDLYIGTRNNGIYVLNPDSGNLMGHYNSDNIASRRLSSDLIFDMSQLNDSLLFVACGALDLVNVKSGYVHHLKLEDQTSARANKLLLDKNGILWFNNPQGIYAYDYEHNRFLKFNTKNGLVNDQAMQVVSSSGKIFLSGTNMITGFFPDQIITSGQVPSTSITEIHLFNTSLPADSLLHANKVAFKYNHNSLSFYFSTLSFLPGKTLTYYYRLKGATSQWTMADASQSVTYSLLPPGSYTFEVYSDDSKGSKSSVTSFSFIIRPPFWSTWWFITICLIIIGVSIHIFYRERIRRLMAIQQVRQRVARDLHDDMGSTLSSINILSGMAEEKLKADPIQSREYITKIKDNSKSMMEAMNYIVWSINPNNDSMQKVLVRMRTFATEVLESKGIDLQFTTNKQVEQIQLDMERKRDLFLIYKEAVNNAAKYSECTLVTISLQLKNHHIQLNVQDNGKGFLPNEIHGGGNGLDNMQKRALALKGSLEIHSVPGQGTRLFLSMPVK